MSEKTPITGSFIWTLEDAKTRQDVLAGTPMTVKGKFITYALTVTLITISLAFIAIRGGINFPSFFDDPYLASIPLVVFIIIILVFSYSRNANLRKGFLQSPDRNKRVDVTVTYNEIIMKVEGISETRWNWNTIKEVRRNPKGFCFFLAEQIGFWIPIRAFQSQADADSMAELVRHLEQERPSLKYREFV